MNFLDEITIFFALIFSMFLFLFIPSYGQSPEVIVSIPQEGTSEFCGKFHVCFIPIEVLTQAESTVTWINDDLTSTHTITSGDVVVGPDGKFNSGSLGPTQSFSYTFEEVGIYPYYCTIHPWKEGLIKITPVTSQESTLEITAMERLEIENAELKRQIQVLQDEIAKLRQIVTEQMKVIFEWVSTQ